MEYIAHIRENDGAVQTVRRHLEEVQFLSEGYGEKIGVKHLAGLSGLLHDLGKSTENFRTYIKTAVENPEKAPRRGSVDHSTAGGKLLYERFHQEENDGAGKLAAEWLAMCIISHHSGLRDFLGPDISSDFLKRVSEKDIEQYEEAVAAFFEEQVSPSEFDAYFAAAKEEAEIILTKLKQDKLQPITLSLMIRYIFSCLIDADRTNTRMFEEGEQVQLSFNTEEFFETSYALLMEKLSSFKKTDNPNAIHLLRSEMSEQCEAFASRPSGVYTLSIPTGGGKTLASLRYALKHALLHKKERIIYIVPYTTIIEQNAQEVREILRTDTHILEHHSNVIETDGEESEGYEPEKKKLKLAKDNWDSPIIFTTMVQFLNVFYSKGTRNVRRLHNLSNSILIFDEVQSVPVKCISLFNEALNFLSTFGKSSLVLCTATQPALSYVENKLKITSDAEMVADLPNVSESFKRVDVVDRTTPGGYTAAGLKQLILEEMEHVNSVLVILNTKSAVRKLFEEFEQTEAPDFQLFHLSTSMCAAHRKDILSEVREALKKGEKVICISTQLIEAGVDISFACVVRSLAGLDSIAQAAGRCNRHGEMEKGNVYIINSADETLSRLKEIRTGAEQTKRILTEFKENPQELGGYLLAPKAIERYFLYYYKQVEGDLKYPVPELQKDLTALLNMNQDYFQAYKNKYNRHPGIVSRQSFKTAEKYFSVIDSPTTSILVPYNGEAEEIILALNGELDSKEIEAIMKKAQQYTINIFDHEIRQLEKNGDIYFLFNGEALALRELAYSKERGLDLKGEGSWTSAII